MSYNETAAKLQSALIQAGRTFRGMLRSGKDVCRCAQVAYRIMKADAVFTTLKALCIHVNEGQLSVEKNTYGA
eukprot:905-Heterococcus_DN1.PRE.3